MKSYKRRGKPFRLTPMTLGIILLPIVMILLFYLFRNQTKVMEGWVNTGLAFCVRWMGSVSSLFPFSLGEGIFLALGGGLIVFLLSRIYLCFCVGQPFLIVQHGVFLLSLVLWLWAWMCWFWNPLYYIPSFAERSGLDVSPYPVEELQLVTEYFAFHANRLSTEMPRTEEGYFSLPRETYIASALSLYDTLEVEYPFLARENVKVKSLLLSEVQSIFGFTGVYSPFTGEANINIHTPAVFHPVTIAHEMAHQRLIAPELEANFLGIASCLDSEDPVFQYSGYLFGLIQLSNALYSVMPDSWQELVDLYFTAEMSIDWQQNYNYWKAYESPVEDVAKDVYDNFLKSNAQELGIRSYGACVDLLVAYYGAEAWEEENNFFQGDETFWEDESEDVEVES